MKSFFKVVFVFCFIFTSTKAQKMIKQGNIEISFADKFGIAFPKGFIEPQRSKSKDTKKSSRFTFDNDRGTCILSYNNFDQTVFDLQTEDEILDGIISGYRNEGENILSNTFFRQENKKNGYFLSSSEGKFKISLPPGFDRPDKSIQTIPTDEGNIDMTMYTKEGTSGVCLIAFSDYPDIIFDKKSTSQILNDAMNGAIKNQKATLLVKTKLLHENLPGLSFIVSSKVGKTTVYTRHDYCLKKPRLYQVKFITFQRSDLEKKEVKDFFKSLKISN